MLVVNWTLVKVRVLDHPNILQITKKQLGIPLGHTIDIFKHVRRVGNMWSSS